MGRRLGLWRTGLLSPEQAPRWCLPGPTPLAYLQAVQGHYPSYRRSLACHRRVGPSLEHSGSYDCCCKPKKRIEKSVTQDQGPPGLP